MVSKVAVIALVIIVACPILLGYGMNLENTTHTDYKESKNPVNVTNLIENGEYYNTAYADIYKLNTNYSIRTGSNFNPAIPIYEKQSTTQSTLPYTIGSIDNWTGGSINLATIDAYFIMMYYTFGTSAAVNVGLYHNTTLLETLNGVHYLYYDRATDSITYTYTNGDNHVVSGYTSGGDYTSITYGRVGGLAPISLDYGILYQTGNTSYIDLSAGFRVPKNSIGNFSYFDFPNYTSTYVITVNLDSMTNNNEYIKFFDSDTLYIYKTTVDGEVQYYAKHTTDTENTYLYYDPNRTDNTYQIYSKFINLGLFDDGYYHYYVHRELRYLGSWPTFIGEAPYYLTYNLDAPNHRLDHEIVGISAVEVYTNNDKSAIIRLDSARFTGMLFTTIKDNTYDPATFRTNPTTTITNISLYGSALSFGGVTYDVTDGNITLGTHDVSISKAVFDSIPVAGGYANRINGVTVSNTALPSTITFHGHWKAQVITDSMESSTYTSTDWIVGQFAWDGIDTNFLIVGLITSIGMFIVLGIHTARTKAKFWPVLLVCGGAAILFLTML